MQSFNDVDSIERQAEADVVSRDWRAELKRIVEFLNVADDDASTNLWKVLSAFRGPDVPDEMEVLKRSTTAVIRHAAGLRIDGLTIHPDMACSVDVRANLTMIDHFTWHAMTAFNSLGLTWNTLNDQAGAPTQ